MSKYPKPKRPNGFALLCLDAGGARAISQLIILGDVMRRCRTHVKPEDTHEIAPCEAFDAICGVGIGGLVSILLVVLGMTTEDALKTVQQVGETILSKNKHSPAARSTMLREWAIKLLKEHDIDPKTGLLENLDRSRGCRLIVPITSKENTGALARLRNYHSREPPLDVTIVEAILATCADPELFDPMSIQRHGMTQQYVSGAIILPNPIREFISEAYDCFGGDAKVVSLISLGAGYSKVISIPSTSNPSVRMEFLDKTIKDAEKVAQEMQAQMGRLPLYVRLSVQQGFQDIPFDAWKEAMTISARTRTYLQDVDVDKKLEDGVDSLAFQRATTTLEQLHHSGGNVVLPPAAPSLTSYFVERPGPMAALVDSMTSTDDLGTQKVAVISGLGGCGKTTLVLKYIKDNRTRYQSVFFVDGGSRDSNSQNKEAELESTHARVRASLTQHIRSLGSEHSQKSFEDALLYLSQPIEGERLIVFDNIDDPEFDLDPYLPDCPCVSIIITTRDPDRGQLALHKPIILDTMSPKEALELLFLISKRTRNSEEETGALIVAETLGFHPIALVQAASYIAQTKTSWEGYMRVHEQSRKELLDRKIRNQRGMRYNSAYAAFDASYEALPTQAQQLLHLLSFFHRFEFPLEVIWDGADRDFAYARHHYMGVDEQFRQGKELLKRIFYYQGEWNEHHMNSLIATLQSYSFISITEKSFTRLVSLHSLIHTWAHDRVNGRDGSAYRNAAIRLLSGGSSFSEGPVNRYLALHVIHFSSSWDKLNVTEKGSFGTTLHIAGIYEAAKQLSQAVLDTVKQMSPVKPIQVAVAASKLAATLHRSGHYTESMILTEEALELVKEAYGENHDETFRIMFYLTASYRKQGRLEEAMKMGEDVLKRRKELVGEENVDTIRVSAGLASTYSKLGRHEEALAMREEVLRLRKKLLGVNHSETIRAAEHLASTYFDLGRYSDALKTGEEALRLRKVFFGEEHPTTLRALGSLGPTYRMLGRVPEALNLEEETLRLQRKVLGSQHLETMRTASHLATTYRTMGRFQEALVLEMDVLKRRKEVLGNEHPRTVKMMKNMAPTYEGLGRHEEAEALRDEANIVEAARKERMWDHNLVHGGGMAEVH